MFSLKKFVFKLSMTLIVLMTMASCSMKSKIISTKNINDTSNPSNNNENEVEEETEIEEGVDPLLLAEANTQIEGLITANSKCKNIGDFYWVIGDKSGKLIDGSKGTTYNEDTRIPIFSASKMVFGAYVLEKLGGKNNLTDAIERGLNFTAGYTSPDKSFCKPTDTVVSCFQDTLASSFNQNDFNSRKFFYGSAHMQGIASAPPIDLGNKTHSSLGQEINAILDFDSNLEYIKKFEIKAGLLTIPVDMGPVLAGGIKTDAKSYSILLTKIVDETFLNFKDALGHKSVHVDNCLGANCLMYSMGHWVENNFDGAYSSMGAMGFYPWISKTKNFWGMVVRYDNVLVSGQDNAKESQECGKQIRKSFLQIIESDTYETL